METARPDSSAQDRLRALFDEAGARWVELPVLYPADPFLETAGEDIRRKMFVTEGRRGESLALRPDFTIPVCLHHLHTGAAAGRYSYRGLVFRRHDSGAPERLEAGCEDIGRAEQTLADAETVALAVSAAAAISPTPITVRLGDIGLFAALLSALGLPEPWRRRLRRSFGLPQLMAANLDRLSAPRGTKDARLDGAVRAAADSHARDELVALLEDRLAAHGHGEGVSRSAAEIADRFLDARALAETHIDPAAMECLRSFLGVESELAGAAAALRDFQTQYGVDFGEALPLFSVRAREIAKRVADVDVRFEAGFGRPLDYYTGLVFEVRVAGHRQPISGGGRYDRLMELLGAGRPVPAVGFTMRLDLADEEAGA